MQETSFTMFGKGIDLTENMLKQFTPFDTGYIITGNELFWAKVKPNAIIPTKTDDNAGYDIYAYDNNEGYLIEPNSTKLIPTGIAVAVSNDYYLQVQERGSTGSKGIKYGAGVIDSNYRGEIFIVITNTNPYKLLITSVVDEVQYTTEKTLGRMGLVVDHITSLMYPMSKAIAQLVVHNVPKMEPKEISYEELKMIRSDRGIGALGSSGK